MTDNLEEDLLSYELHNERPAPTLQNLRVESVTVLKMSPWHGVA